MTVRIGLVGKANTGKTTFWNSATLQEAEMSNYPFTTKTPNVGTAFVVAPCICREMGVKDDPVNSKCLDGFRYVPVELVDLPGLIIGASEGKGLGNQFLSVASQSDALIHVVDASGSIDEEGRIADPGTGDPVKDFEEIEGELVAWYVKIIEKNRDKMVKLLKSVNPVRALAEPLNGMRIRESDVDTALRRSALDAAAFESWTSSQLWKFTGALREVSKPTLILANKMDLPGATKNYGRLRDANSDLIVAPASAESELALRRAEQAGLIKYNPTAESFHILDERSLTPAQRSALQLIQRLVLKERMRTGVQFALGVTVCKPLRINEDYPVYDVEKLSDKHRHVLPDAHLLPDGNTVKDMALQIHTELAKGLLYAVDARMKLRLPADYVLKDRDVLSVVSARRKLS
ncbi:MAG: redox-regulated ATPase YchF [Nitrososphaerota archaeon]|nr:redox-regulated ATPase YchF [Nitrososphaerota archaeon]